MVEVVAWGIAGSFAGLLLLWGGLTIADWVRRRGKTRWPLLVGALLLGGGAAVVGLALPGVDAVPASDAARFRQYSLPEYQRMLAGFSALATDVHAFVWFIDNRVRSTQSLCVAGRLTRPPAPIPEAPGALRLGDYWLFPEPGQADAAAREWPVRLVARFGRDERAFWQERWAKRGGFYALQGQLGCFWFDPETNFFIACFQ